MQVICSTHSFSPRMTYLTCSKDIPPDTSLLQDLSLQMSTSSSCWIRRCNFLSSYLVSLYPSHELSYSQETLFSLPRMRNIAHFYIWLSQFLNKYYPLYLPECKSRGAFGRQHITGIESANCKLSLEEKLERRKLPNVPSQMMLLVVYVYPSY